MSSNEPSQDGQDPPRSSSARMVSRRSILAGAAKGGAALAALGAGGTLMSVLGGAEASAAPTKLLGTVPFQLGWVKNVAYSGSFIADKRGYYRAHGVDVEILPGGPSVQGMPLLVDGKVFVAISDPPTVAGAIAAGADVKVIAAGYQENPACIMSLASSPITTPQDLIGKKIGVGASDDSEWYAFLAANKISKTAVTTLPASFDPSPVASGVWDGYLAFINNEPATFEAKGIKTAILPFAKYGMPSMNEVYVTQTASLSDPVARKKVIAFMAGEIQGWNVAIADPALATSLTVNDYAKGSGLSYKGEYIAAKASIALTVDATTKKHGLFYMSPSLIAETVKTLQLTGVKATADMFDTTVLPEVYPLVNG